MKKRLSAFVAAYLCFCIAGFGEPASAQSTGGIDYPVINATVKGFSVSGGVGISNNVGDTITYTIAQTATEVSNVEVHLFPGSKIVVSDGSREAVIVAARDDYYPIGRMDFRSGGTVTVTANAVGTKVGKLVVTPAEVMTLISNDAETFSGFSVSGAGTAALPGAKAYYSTSNNSAVSWKIPERMQNQGAIDFYYYIPSINGSQTTTMAMEVVLKNNGVEERSWYFGNMVLKQINFCSHQRSTQKN